jgi:cysteinyl-tRNA synthetase
MTPRSITTLIPSGTEVGETDKFYHQFNLSAKVYLRRGLNLGVVQRFDEEEKKFEREFVEKKIAIHNHLCNNLDTPSMLRELNQLMTNMNIYMKRPEHLIRNTLLKTQHTYIMNMLQTCWARVRLFRGGCEQGRSHYSTCRHHQGF